MSQVRVAQAFHLEKGSRPKVVAVAVEVNQFCLFQSMEKMLIDR